MGSNLSAVRMNILDFHVCAAAIKSPETKRYKRLLLPVI
uniref:Uncharacterized protein n=1 Tax=Rhizophora mucronata TaxID=61149 RepID=A0A2P2LEN0_RHIMU